MFQSLQKLPVVQFSTEVADHALVDCFGLFLPKIQTIFESMDDRVVQIND